VNITAEKMLQGKITQIRETNTGVEVLIRVPGGDEVIAVLTKTAAEKLELEIGKPLFRTTRLVAAA